MDIHHIIPQAVYKKYKDYFKSIGFDVHDTDNLIPLTPSFHGSHKALNDYVSNAIQAMENGNADISKISELQDKLRGQIFKAMGSGNKLNDYYKKR
jgi:hypothetical protein